MSGLETKLEAQTLETERLSKIESEGKEKVDGFVALKEVHDTTLVNLKEVEARLETSLKNAGSHEELRSTWLREIDEKRRVLLALIYFSCPIS